MIIVAHAFPDTERNKQKDQPNPRAINNEFIYNWWRTGSPNVKDWFYYFSFFCLPWVMIFYHNYFWSHWSQCASNFEFVLEMDEISKFSSLRTLYFSLFNNHRLVLTLFPCLFDYNIKRWYTDFDLKLFLITYKVLDVEYIWLRFQDDTIIGLTARFVDLSFDFI